MPAQLAERKRRGEELGLLQDTGHKGGNKVIGNVKRKRHRFKSFKEQVKEVRVTLRRWPSCGASMHACMHACIE